LEPVPLPFARVAPSRSPLAKAEHHGIPALLKKMLAMVADKMPRQRAAVAAPQTRITDMGLIISLIIGGIVGWLASLIMKTDAQMGLIANVLVGVVGSALGFWIAGLLGIAPAGILRFVVAIAGAALLIFILAKLGIVRRP
jgi:uncharacterized membrane protein YeaQ/YmgE (transglycosylase-associated protein family)